MDNKLINQIRTIAFVGLVALLMTPLAGILAFISPSVREMTMPGYGECGGIEQVACMTFKQAYYTNVAIYIASTIILIVLFIMFIIIKSFWRGNNANIRKTR